MPKYTLPENKGNEISAQLKKKYIIYTFCPAHRYMIIFAVHYSMIYQSTLYSWGFGKHFL